VNTAAAMAVVDIDGEAAFDKTISSAGGSLVIVDYSTTWCGPCKVIAPKFDEFSEKYPDAVFLKVCLIRYIQDFPLYFDTCVSHLPTFFISFCFSQVIGDASPDNSKLMKREGVRSVPSFHLFKSGEKVDVVNGANAEAIEAAITKHLS